MFRPRAARPAAVLAGVAGGAALVALALVARGVTGGVTFASFVSYLLAVALLTVAATAGYWSLALLLLRYEIRDGALVIFWGLTRQIVPLAAVQRLVRGRSLSRPRVTGLTLPRLNCAVGHGRVRRLGEALFFSTHETPADILYVVTEHEIYGISPLDQDGLIAAIQAALAVEAGSPPRQELVRHPLLALPAWGDRYALAATAIMAAFALAAAAVIFARYTALTTRIVLPFPDGDHIGAKRELLGIPATALFLMVLNSAAALALHRPLRPAAFTLLLGGIAVEALLLVAALAAT